MKLRKGDCITESEREVLEIDKVGTRYIYFKPYKAKEGQKLEWTGYYIQERKADWEIIN